MSPLLIFDLDGTLADTLDDIVAAVNHVTIPLGGCVCSRDDCRTYLAAGTLTLLEHILPGRSHELHARLASLVRARYSEHLLDRSSAYAGVVVMLDQLAARSLPMAVLSNKPAPLLRRLVSALFGHRFAAVEGARAGVPSKPEPTSALMIARRMGVRPGATALVGDTVIDIDTAKNAGMVPIAVSWGWGSRRQLIRHGAAFVLDEPSDLVTLCASAEFADPGAPGLGSPT